MTDLEFMAAVQEHYQMQLAKGKNKYAAKKSTEEFRSALRISIAKQSIKRASQKIIDNQKAEYKK